MDCEPQVAAWIKKRALPQLSDAGWAQVDVDELLEPEPARAVEVMLNCMTYAIASARKTHESVSGLVVIPLPDVEDQLSPPMDHPTLAELLRGRWAYGRGRTVPGLYLFRWGTTWVETHVEEYRMGLPQPGSGHQAYYRAWRTFEDRAQAPGEWARAIYVFSPAEHPRYRVR